jgi:calcineurin-like phosphoesterase family protein
MIKLTRNLKKVHVTSDSHYGHTNICRGVSRWGTTDETGQFHVNVPATRDFANLKEMNAALVDSINSSVAADDLLIHLGDWSFGGEDKVKEFRDKIRCKNIILILGNHDGHIQRNIKREKELFAHISQYEEMKINGEHSFVLFHYPIECWNGMHHDTIMLQGHQHLKGEAKFKPGKRMDVGACGNDMKPYSMEEIVDIMRSRSFQPLAGDHHK